MQSAQSSNSRRPPVVGKAARRLSVVGVLPPRANRGVGASVYHQDAGSLSLKGWAARNLLCVGVCLDTK